MSLDINDKNLYLLFLGKISRVSTGYHTGVPVTFTLFLGKISRVSTGYRK